MKSIFNECVERIQNSKQRYRRYVAVLLVLSLCTTLGVNWGLHQNGIAQTTDYQCGLTEHQHTEDCYSTNLSCDSEEHTHTSDCYDADGNLSCDKTEHAHTDGCYKKEVVCGLEEHTHTMECMIDENADVENASVWENTIPSLSGVWADDLVAVAESQIGYEESTKNYQLADDGETKMGYTRYGAWYGNKYGAWSAMFVDFCLHYANVSGVPTNSGCNSFMVGVKDADLFKSADSYEPKAGDIVFIKKDGDGTADSMGIVESVSGTTLTAIEGDSNDRVEKNTYTTDEVLGYAELPENTRRAARAAARVAGNDVNAVSDSDSVNLTDIEEKTITLKKSDGNGKYSEVGKDEVLTAGDDILLDITFTTTKDTFNGKENAVVTYQLPKGIQLASEQSGDIVSADGDGAVLGKYTIDTNGLVTMDFDEAEINKAQKFTATLEFRAKASNSGSDDKTTYKFDGTDTEFTVQKKADIDVKKELVSETPEIKGNDKYYHFKVTVSTENGTMGTVNIGDNISSSDKYEVKGTYVDKKVSSTITAPKITKKSANGNESKVDKKITIDNNERKISIEELPKLSAGESYILDYWVKLDESGITSSDGSGEFKNKAYADIEGKIKDSDEAKIEIEATKPTIEKSGTYENGQIKWIITVNNPGHELNGYTVKDALSESGIPQTITGNITLTGYTGGKGTVIKSDISADGNGKGFTYTFGTQMDADYYTFTYYTRPNESSGDGTAANTAKLIKDGEEKGTAEGEVGVSSGDITKKALRSNKNGEIKELRWRIEADNLKSGWKELTLTDVIKQPTLNGVSDPNVDAHYAIYKDIKAELENTDNAWTFYKPDGSTLTLSEAKTQGITMEIKYYTDEAGKEEAQNDDDHVHRIDITIKKGSYDGEITKVVLNDGDSYADSYHTVFDPSKLTKGGKYKIPNTVTLNGDKSSTDEFSDEKTVPLTKLASSKDAGDGKKGDYAESGVKVDYNYDGNTMIYYSLLLECEKKDFEESGTVIVTDTLPEGVEFVPDTAYAQFRNGSSAYSSTSGSKSKDPYNINEGGHFTATYEAATRTVTFTINGLNSKTEWDGNFRGFAIRYGVKVTDDYWKNWDKDQSSKTYTNTAKWGEYEATNDVKVDREEKNIVKTSAYDEDKSEVTYTVEINPFGETFKDSNGNVLDCLKLTDDLTIPSRVTASLDRTSISLTDKDGNKLSASEYTFDVSDEVKKNNNVYRMELTVPNGKHLTLTYTYKINRIGQNGMDGFTVSNTAELNGESSGKKKVEFDNIDSSATVRQTKLTIYKVDSEHMDLPLSGAKFTLYVYNTETGAFDEVNTYESNASGEVQLTYTDTSSTFRANALYKLVETDAPSGYMKRETPVYFIWHESSESEDDAFQAATGGNNIAELEGSPEIHYYQTLMASSLTIQNTKRNDSYELPETGGIGVTPYTAGGIAVMGTALLCGYSLRRRRERRGK